MTIPLVGADLPVGQTAYYESDKMKVTRMRDVSNFNFYIHSLAAGGKFTLNATITHDTGKTGTLDGGNISDVYEVYYYKNTANKGALKVKAMDGDKIFYNTDTSQSTSQWKNQETTPITGATDKELNAIVTKIENEVEIKVDKTKPYGCKKRIIVEKKVGAATSNPVPNDYVRYKHTATTTTFTLNSVKHNDQELKGVVESGGQTSDVKAVYVYYHTSDVTKHEFPLIVCVKFSSSWKYYTRGNEWKEDTGLQNINPESPAQGDLGRLKTELNAVKGNSSCILLL